MSRQTWIFILCLSALLQLPAGLTPAPAASVRSTSSLRSMARIYMASGSYDKAQPLLENALELARSTNAADSETCACALDLAFLYKNQGRLAEAEEMCLAGLALQEKVHGSNHPHLAHSLRILSEIYQGQVRYRKAAESLERAIAIMRKVAGEDAVEIAPLKVDMARLLVTQGQYNRAGSLFAEALTAIEAGYGPEHAYTAKVLTSMAALYLRQGRHRRAEELAARARIVLEEVYGSNHRFLVPVWLVMSGAYQARGKLIEAKALLEKSLAATSGQTAYGRLVESDVLNRLGEFHILCENHAKAEPVLRKALVILEDTQEADSDRRAAVLGSLAKVQMNMDRNTQAQELCLKALDILERVFDEHHPLVADVLETQAESHRRSGDETKADRLEKRAQQIRLQRRLAFAHNSVAVQ